MQKIRYRLVYNRKKQLNRQGTALIQVECRLNGRNIYFTTNLYLRPEHWDRNTAQVVNHPQKIELNAMLFDYIIHLQKIELDFWKQGIQPTLALMREAVRNNKTATIPFLTFARMCINSSDRKENTKENLLSTVSHLEKFRPGIDFKDLTYSFVRDFESWLRKNGKSTNTTSKHLRQLRTLVNEAINEGYIKPDAYPFRKFKIKKEKTEHKHLTPDELSILENLSTRNSKQRHVLDAFLFCCYTGLRYSDFCSITQKNIIQIDRSPWLVLTMQKTNLQIKLPLSLLFAGKALNILSRYSSIEEFSSIPSNCETNRIIAEIRKLASIHKPFTFHAARHTCATLLVHQGVAITTVQKVLGHTSVKTTQLYSEIMSDTIVKDLKSSSLRLSL